MRAAAIQIPARWDQAERTLAELASVVPPGAFDLIVLPECSINGYVSPDGDCDVRRFAEPLHGPTLALFRSLSQRWDAAIAAPLVERSDALVFNTHVVVSASGELLAHYRKRHLWHPETTTTPGDLTYPTFAIGDHQCTLAICYDVHFLDDEATTQLETADTLIFPSAWVDLEDSRPTLFKEIALRYNINIVNANWGRGVPRQPGQGNAQIVDRTGVQVSVAPSRTDAITWAEATLV